MNWLAAIMAERRLDAALAKREIGLGALEEQARQRRHRDLRRAACDSRSSRLIAEMKRASPSAGILCRDYRPAEIARQYRDGGAAAVSVLTEPRYFGGDPEHLRTVRAVVDVPILRKDFISDPYQVLETAAWGADIVLLIVGGLARSQLRDLYDAARSVGLDVLAEAHTEAEMEWAADLPDAWIGVNSRNLETLQTDPRVLHSLGRRLPPGRFCVAESGLRAREEIAELEALGYGAFLIGETLMRAADPTARLRELAGLPPSGQDSL